MTMPSASRSDIWERRVDSVYSAIPYFLLAVSTLLAALQGGQSWAYVLGTLGLAGLAAAWTLWMVTLHPTWAARRGLMAVYYAGLLGSIAILLTRSPWFGMLAFTGYLHAFAFLPRRWAFVGVAASAMLAATAQRGGLPRGLPQLSVFDVSAFVLVIALNASLAGAFSYIGVLTSEQNGKRKQVIAELAETNRRLAITLEENAGLYAQLLTQAREAGVLDERQRMAREIHDTLAQGFAGIIAQLEAAEQARDRPEQWRGHVDQARTLARESLSEARRSVQALRPGPLEGSRLPEAIATMARRWAETARVALHFETTGEPRPLLAELEVALFRAAQEALTNVAKHAKASRVGVTLSYMDDVVLLDVRDDGAGFTIGAMGPDGLPGEAHGFGLSAMKQRLRQAGGTLEIESACGAGIAINASVPAIAAEGDA